VAGLCLALVSLGFAIDQLRGYHTFAGTALPIALLSAGAHLERHRRTAASALLRGVRAAGDRARPARVGTEPPTGFVTFYLALVLAWGIGAWLRSTRVAEAERRRHVAEDTRTAERTRIARELHDVVTHHVTAMVVQAEAARYLTAAPERLDQTLTAVTDTGRRAITDLRHLLDLLNPDHGTEARTPSVGRLLTLVEQTRRAGQPVEFTEEGSRRSRPAAPRLVAYRVVQEALTNALKYAHGSRTFGPGAPRREGDHRGGQHGRFRLAGRRPPAGAGGASPGLRERVDVLGGEFSAGGGRRWLRRTGPDTRGEPVVTAPIRVLVCDDQVLIRTGLVTIIDAQPDLEVAASAGRAGRGRPRRPSCGPDVVVMDVRMPVLDGIEATRLLAGAGVPHPVKVLVVTTFNLDEYVYEALRAGASGFLLKDAPPAQLLHGIRTVATGAALLDPEVTRRLVGRYAARIRPADGSRHDIPLTPRELEVLRLIATASPTARSPRRWMISLRRPSRRPSGRVAHPHEARDARRSRGPARPRAGGGRSTPTPRADERRPGRSRLRAAPAVDPRPRRACHRRPQADVRGRDLREVLCPGRPAVHAGSRLRMG
jgi:DNA-binding NarL/FixJ family response regulator